MEPLNPSSAAAKPSRTACSSSPGRGRILTLGAEEVEKPTSCCKGNNPLKVDRPPHQRQLRTYLKHCYPKYLSASQHARIKKAGELLDSVELYTFDDIIKEGLDAFKKLALPIGLYNVLLEGLCTYLQTGCQVVFSSLHLAEMQAAAAKYDEFRRKVDLTNSNFSCWHTPDMAQAQKVKDQLEGIANATKSIIPPLNYAIELLDRKDNGRIAWAVDAFISKNRIAKNLRILPKTPEFDIDPDPEASLQYANLLQNKDRSLGEDLDHFKVAPFTWDSLLALHHIVWHAKYANASQNLREGEYFLHTHNQMLTLYRLWLKAYELPDLESTEDLEKGNKTLPPFRGSDQFHKYGGYASKGLTGEFPVPYRPAGCPTCEETWCYANILFQKKTFLEAGILPKEGDLYRLPTKTELESTEWKNTKITFGNMGLNDKNAWADKWERNFFFRHDKIKGIKFLTPADHVNQATLKEYRKEIQKYINKGWKFPFTYKTNKGEIPVMTDENPLWMSLSLFGSLISEVFKGDTDITRSESKTGPNKDDKTIQLMNYHQYYHQNGAMSMLPEYLNVKDPLFWMWHRELDDYRLKCVLAFNQTTLTDPKTKTTKSRQEDLTTPTIPIGDAANIKIHDVLIKEHEGCTPLTDYAKLKDDQKSLKKSSLGKRTEVSGIKGIEDYDEKKKAFTKSLTDLGGKDMLDHFVLIGADDFQMGWEVAKSAYIPFAWYIRLGTSDGAKLSKSALLSVRMFMAPTDKVDDDNNRWWYEIDKFSVEFPKGKSSMVVARSILESAVCMRSSILMVDDNCPAGQGGEKCDCGLPWNLLLPPGGPDTKEIDYTLFVMVTDAKEDVLPGMKLAATNFSLTMCWGKGKGTPDKQSMGYPFAAVPVQKPSQMAAVGGHMYTRTLKIKRTEIQCRPWVHDGKGKDKSVEGVNIGTTYKETATKSQDILNTHKIQDVGMTDTYFEYVSFNKDAADKDDMKALEQKVANLILTFAKEEGLTLDKQTAKDLQKKVDKGPNDTLGVQKKKKCIVM
mmetsp:Transcript_52430/g.131830  ORF Transcript_52430/g.131830 Transcript_52430/m.131830 type:complete len:1021 (+) Transcript_52430:83-3145(+)|eukprot:CAMPEP_0177648310 /NCGR_PEP_ID=MMETSP0447-20121125/10761_1 /TAXON_ID=0 /ORGANISM="Stygamoeba regulata, Strain BSH-02190019" /LENGTH=1020 /DNA_ID=CAMNT_0019150945 /DNA_START=92 /DNA_END=3154 /DNA_ORIENTATION=+